MFLFITLRCLIKFTVNLVEHPEETYTLYTSLFVPESLLRGVLYQHNTTLLSSVVLYFWKTLTKLQEKDFF